MFEKSNLTIPDPTKYHSFGTHERGNPDRVMSRSQLWDMQKCPRKWLRSKDDDKSTDAMAFGSLVDCLALTPDLFEKRYVEIPPTYGPENKPWNWNAKECKLWRADCGKDDLIPVREKDIAEAKLAAAAYRRKRFKAFLEASSTQVVVVADWHDEETGIIVPIRVMADLVPDPGSEFGDTLADLKTARSAEERDWSRAVFYEGYHFQAAIYLDVINAALGLKYKKFEHHIIENSAPYEATYRPLSDDFISIGRGHYINTLRDYCRALQTGKWRGYDCAPVEPESWMI